MSDMTKCATSGLLVPEGYCAGRVEGDCIHATRAREHMETMVEFHRQEGLPPPIMGGARCGCVTPEVLGCQCVGQSSNSIELTGTATAGNPWTWNARLDPASNNALSLSAAGLFAPLTASLVDLEVFTSSGSFVKAGFPGLTRVLFVLQAGGGGGGGASSTGSGQVAAGAGGAGGGAVENLLLAAALSSSETVTIGSGGNGGTASGDGAAGANSVFGAHATANGGGGGPGGSLTAGTGATLGSTGAGGTGGVVTFGGDGAPAAYAVGSVRIPGTGGGSRFGGGKRGRGSGSGNGASAPANSGAGGGGANNGASQPAAQGGNGGSGICVVYVYR